MNRLKSYTIIGIIFVLILGSLSHFFYEWSNNNFIVGLLAPINESTWEHMKLLFFPMLLYSFIAIPALKNDFPYILSSLFSGILIGTLLIPVVFYTYTGILGYHTLILDIATFVLSVILSFYFSYVLTLCDKMPHYTALLFVAVCLFCICFIVFTYYPPGIGLFADPEVRRFLSSQIVC